MTNALLHAPGQRLEFRQLDNYGPFSYIKFDREKQMILLQKKYCIICTYTTILLKISNSFLHHLQVCRQVVLSSEK